MSLLLFPRHVCFAFFLFLLAFHSKTKLLWASISSPRSGVRPARVAVARARQGRPLAAGHTSVEVWSLGCLVLEAFSHPYTPPFGNASAQDIRERLRQGERPTGLSLFMQSTPLTQESESGIFKKKKNCKYSAKTFALLRGEVLPFLYKAFQVRIIIVGLMVFLHHNYRLRSSHSSTGRCGASFALRRERAGGELWCF